MKWWATFTLLIFSIIWIGWSLTFGNDALVPSDCSYTNTEDCRARIRFGPDILMWRTIAVELIAVTAYLILLRKR
jgi:hypothetical protein